ncbi:MAG: holin, BlyA family protein [Lachnospiraceae bacterium]|nr:holin, BlyA family protein [Lachnospiraceae bacterium]
MSKKIKDIIRRFLVEEDGIGTVEMILILVVLIGLVVIFRNQLTNIINNIFQRIATDSSAL